MPSSSSLLSVAGIIFLENVWRCGKVESLFPSAVPFPMRTADCPIRAVVTRAFRKRGSSTTEGLRPHLIIASLHCLHTLQPTSSSVFSMHPLLQARSSYQIASWRVLWPVLPRNGFCSGHAMLIVILHTLRQPFPCQLLLSKCWGPCDIRRKPPPTDTSFYKRYTQGKLPESVMS